MPVPTAGRSSGGAAELGTILSGVFGYLFGKSKEKECLNQQKMQYEKELKEYNFQAETYVSGVNLKRSEKTGKFSREKPGSRVAAPIIERALRPAPITPQFVNIQGRWMGQNGIVQDWGGNMGPGCDGGSNPDHSGSDNCSSESFDRGFCFENEKGDLDRCYR
jgi:hypothetical protein